MFSKNLLRVNEIFGPTFQGEGVHAGKICLFVRLYDCNLTCKWCDTPYTWANTPERAEQHKLKVLYNKSTEMREMSVNDVLKELGAQWKLGGLYGDPPSPIIVVFSGGEPMMQQEELEPLVASLALNGHDVHIETAGTIPPRGMFDRFVKHYTVSPKLANSGNRESKRYKPEILKWFANEPVAWFKFVVSDDADLEEVDNIVFSCGILRQKVQIMPEGTNVDGIMAKAINLAPAVLRRGYGMSLRNHILIWGNERER